MEMGQTNYTTTLDLQSGYFLVSFCVRKLRICHLTPKVWSNLSLLGKTNLLQFVLET